MRARARALICVCVRAAQGLSVPLRRELIFDIDLTDYDFLDLTTRNDEGNEIVDLEACDGAWPFAAIGIFLLRYMLREQFGFERFLIVYSGRRGAHLWILDERAMNASDEMRTSIASFVNLELTKNQKRATPQMLKFLCTYELEDVVQEAFQSLIVESDYLNSFANLEDLVDRLELQHASLQNLADDASQQQSTREVWSYIDAKVRRAAKASGQPWFVDRLRETIVAFVWPRIDFNVTKSVNHLIKCPYVAHPKTGRIAVPIDPNDYWRFDPRSAPSLENDLGAPEAWRARVDVLQFVANDPPRLPDLEERRRRRKPPTRARPTTARPDAAAAASPPPQQQQTDIEELLQPAGARCARVVR